MPGEHALLSASGSHIWLHCPPAARQQESFQDNTTEYAEEGRFAHSLAELRLRKHYTLMKPSEFKKELAKLQASSLYSAEMESHIETYMDYISSVYLAYRTQPHIVFERRLDYSAWVPEGFGTGDCVMIHLGDTGGTLQVIDLKYGKGVPVSAEDNPQLKLYALGAVAQYMMLYSFSTVRWTIVQPRLDSISTGECTLDELLAWGESIKPVARLAWEGKGNFCAGEWCQFCRARATCRARMDHFAKLEKWEEADRGTDGKHSLPPRITNAEIGQALEWGKGLAAWLKDLEDYALSECLAGNEVPGWKVVEGRSVRTITDYDAAIAAVTAAGFDTALFYKRLPVAMGEMEKILGKQKDILTPYIVKPPGKPALAPASDKREPYTRATAEQDFAQPQN